MNKLLNMVKDCGMGLLTRARAAIFTAIAYAAALFYCTRAVLAGIKAEGFVDTAVKILMAVVIGALVLAGLYLLFSGTILPTLTQKIQEMFNYGG